MLVNFCPFFQLSPIFQLLTIFSIFGHFFQFLNIFRFRVSISSFDFEFRFRVSISSFDFEFRFRVSMFYFWDIRNRSYSKSDNRLECHKNGWCWPTVGATPDIRFEFPVIYLNLKLLIQIRIKKRRQKQENIFYPISLKVQKIGSRRLRSLLKIRLRSGQQKLGSGSAAGAGASPKNSRSRTTLI